MLECFIPVSSEVFFLFFLFFCTTYFLAIFLNYGDCILCVAMVGLDVCACVCML